MAAKPAANARTVDVTFTLPVDVRADSVALCGEFNDWLAENIKLEHDVDGSWRATVALKPQATPSATATGTCSNGERWVGEHANAISWA